MYVENILSNAIPHNTTNIAVLSSTDAITLGNDFVRTMDQFATSIEDTLDEKVNHRPTAQQWTVCTP